MTPLTSSQALDRYFLDARSRILDVAAVLDRIDRGAGVSATNGDPRMEKIRQALEVLRDHDGRRAERIQKIFSLDYDAGWDRPRPK